MPQWCRRPPHNFESQGDEWSVADKTIHPLPFGLRAAAVEAGSTADSTTYLGRGHAALKALMEGGVFQRYAQDRADIIASGRSFPAPPPPLPPDPLAAWLFPAPNSPPA